MMTPRQIHMVAWETRPDQGTDGDVGIKFVVLKESPPLGVGISHGRAQRREKSPRSLGSDYHVRNNE
jgi:hypothetical protein